jgi:formylglycine-generating enzyme required for sulfatase activity
MTLSDKKDTCPNCGEPVEKGWKLCPACEYPLISNSCPECFKAVKEHWKRCPYCEARLVCSFCGTRLTVDDKTCPSCSGVNSREAGSILTEPMIKMEFAFVPGGRFMMGDTFGEGIETEQPVHEVHIDSFYLARYQVTQAQWKKLMPENPSHFIGDQRPVEQVDFNHVLNFVERLTEINQGRFTFLLPTEAQWEYAARSGGLNEKYAGGNNFEKLAWSEENSGGSTKPVGNKTPNGLGLFDMSGNVWEWCRDFFMEKAYQYHEDMNPLCDKENSDRVIRGGGWNTDAWSVRCARRTGFPSQFFGSALGFRLVLLNQPATKLE